jgi:hypothetical protein
MARVIGERHGEREKKKKKEEETKKKKKKKSESEGYGPNVAAKCNHSKNSSI